MGSVQKPSLNPHGIVKHNPHRSVRRQPRRLRSKIPGPVGILTDELNRIGWQWPNFMTLRRPQGPDLHLLDTDLKYLQHQLREACRIKHYEEVVVERASYDGIERGVDKEASTYHIKQEKDPYRKGCARAIIAGSIWLGPALEHAKLRDSRACPYCTNQGDETLYHL